MPVEITKETVPALAHGHVTVGTSPVRVAARIDQKVFKGILIRAPGASDDTPNTEVIYVGINSSVTADYDSETGGMPLTPGTSLFVPVENPSTLWAISTSGGQDLAWMVV